MSGIPPALKTWRPSGPRGSCLPVAWPQQMLEEEWDRTAACELLIRQYFDELPAGCAQQNGPSFLFASVLEDTVSQCDCILSGLEFVSKPVLVG